jgi:hypothetical protein
MFVVLTCVADCTFEPRRGSLDAGTDRAGRVVAEVMVTDSARNGFRVVYATTDAVTPAKAKEIRSRRHIGDSIARLKAEAPRYFGDMLTTDIWDFTGFALRFDPDPDVCIHNVFVAGARKQNLYIGPNPAIENPAKWINATTLQGVLYINREDISHHTSRSQKVYRYWRCRIPFNLSDTDEHWSHFSEDDRLY